MTLFKKSFLFLSFILLLLVLSGCTIKIGAGSAKGGDGGVWRSDDKGKTWVQKTDLPLSGGKKSSIAGVGVRRMVFDAKDYKVIYLATENNGIIFTADGGETWRQFAKLNKGRVRAVAVAPDSQCVLYAAAENKLFKSNDCGRNWENPYFHQNTQTVLTDIAIDPRNSSVIYISAASGEILKSANSGSTWQAIFQTSGVFIDLFIDPKNSSIIYAAPAKNGVFKSIDGGQNWLSLADNLKSYGGSREYRTLIINPVNPANLVLVSLYGLFKSGDGGQTWTALNLIAGSKSTVVYSAAINPQNSNEIYYTTGAAFLKSTDGGQTWLSQRLPFAKIANKILINPANPNIIYLGAITPQK